MYACQAAETELEGKYPSNSPEADDHGLLTYGMVRALEVCRRSPITYRELVQRIQSDYISMRKSSPTPLLEGPEQDRFVFDQNSGRRPLSIRLSHGDNQKWKIDAGAIHGLSQGSILAVYPPPGDGKPDRLLGHVVITRLGIPESQVGPCDAYGKPIDDPLPEGAQGSRCEVVFLDLGLDRLRFTVDDCDAAGNPLRHDQPSQHEEEWKQLAGELRNLVLRDPRSLLRYVDDRKQADWLVRVGEDRVVLVPGSGWPVTPGGNGPPAFEPDRKAARPAEGVKSALETVARASNLVRLATKQREATALQFGKDLNVELTIKTLADEKDKKGKPLGWQRNGQTIQVGSRTLVQIENREDFDVDVTLLYVDSQFGITPVFPEPGTGELNRLPGHAVKPIGPNEVTGDTTGLEHLVLLVAPVHAEQLPADFSFLRQPPLQVAVREKSSPRQRVRDVARRRDAPGRPPVDGD